MKHGDSRVLMAACEGASVGALAWVGVGCFGMLAVAVISILLPREFTFDESPQVMLDWAEKYGHPVRRYEAAAGVLDGDPARRQRAAVADA